MLDEKRKLDIRITRLDELVPHNALYCELENDEQVCVRRQLDVTRELSVILGERISGL